MAKKDASNKRIIPDLLNMKYEYLLRTIARDGKYFTCELKCLVLVLILYIPGLITTSLTGTWRIYLLEGWRHFVSTIFIGVVMWLLIQFLKKMDKKIRHVSQILSPLEREKNQEGYTEWRRWNRKIREYKRWVLRLASYKWYYFQAVGGAFCGFVVSLVVIKPAFGWVGGNILNELYLRSWYIFLGFFVGACLNYVFGGFWAIRKYCMDVISREEILPLDPDHTGGLRELGRLSLDLDLIVAIPSIAFPLYLILGPEYWSQMKNLEIWMGISALYALLIIFVFFVSISPAHNAMITAKTTYLLNIHKEYKDMHKKLLRRLESELFIDPEGYNRLAGLYNLYDRVESMAVWPLDFRTVLRFAITSVLPLISIGITISLPTR